MREPKIDSYQTPLPASDLHYQMMHDYLTYTSDTESPTNYHRWVLLSTIGALVGRKCWLPFGPWKIYPNQYVLLVGSPGVRKGAAISLGEQLLKDIDYGFFGPHRAAKETMWSEMARMAGQQPTDENKGQPDTDEDLLELDFTAGIQETVAEMYICSDEFTAFTGHGNEDLIMSLTNLWDNKDRFHNPKLTSKSVTLYNPTINILSGTTPENLANALPAAVIGSGFTSRLLLIHGDRGGKISWPSALCSKKKSNLLEDLLKIESMRGPIEVSTDAKKLLSAIYEIPSVISDARFKYFAERRYTHLLKLCLLYALSRHSTTVVTQDVIIANTTLYLAELNMPLALGYFGRSKNSGAANNVLEAIYNARQPLTFRELWKILSTDFNKEAELKEVLANLRAAEKVQVVSLKGARRKLQAYAPMHRIEEALKHDKYIDMSLVTEEERIM